MAGSSRATATTRAAESPPATTGRPRTQAAAVGPVHAERPSAAAASPCRRGEGRGRRAVGDALGATTPPTSCDTDGSPRPRGRSEPAIRDRGGATPGRRPRRSAARGRSRRSLRARRGASRAWSWARRRRWNPAGPGPRAGPGREASAPSRSGRAATAPRPVWPAPGGPPRRGSGRRSGGGAGRATRDRRRPPRRRRPRPGGRWPASPARGRRPDRRPARLRSTRTATPAGAASCAALRTASGSRDPSSTTTISPTGGIERSVARRPSAMSRTGTTAATSLGAGPVPGTGRGWARPASTSRRASARCAGVVGAGCPGPSRATKSAPAGVSVSTAHRRAAHQHAAAVGPAGGGVELDAPSRRERVVGRHWAVAPASTGNTAPVMPLLVSPHTHATSAATSSGCRARPRRCCWSSPSTSTSP